VDKIKISDFAKMELRVGTIKNAEKHPNAEKLLVLKVDIGGEMRQLVAGIAKNYKPDELINRQIVIVANLEPAVLRGIESQGMLLAAEDEEGITLLAPDRKTKDGSLVR
jgi:methionyl-tRNA synthetase